MPRILCLFKFLCLFYRKTSELRKEVSSHLWPPRDERLSSPRTRGGCPFFLWRPQQKTSKAQFSQDMKEPRRQKQNFVALKLCSVSKTVLDSLRLSCLSLESLHAWEAPCLPGLTFEGLFYFLFSSSSFQPQPATSMLTLSVTVGHCHQSRSD